MLPSRQRREPNARTATVDRQGIFFAIEQTRLPAIRVSEKHAGIIRFQEELYRTLPLGEFNRIVRGEVNTSVIVSDVDGMGNLRSDIPSARKFVGISTLGQHQNEGLVIVVNVVINGCDDETDTGCICGKPQDAVAVIGACDVVVVTLGGAFINRDIDFCFSWERTVDIDGEGYRMISSVCAFQDG